MDSDAEFTRRLARHRAPPPETSKLPTEDAWVRAGAHYLAQLGVLTIGEVEAWISKRKAGI